MLSMIVWLWFGCFNPGSAIKRPTVKPVPTGQKVTDDVQYHMLRAMLHTHQHDWLAANTHFEMAAKMRPRDPFIFMHWGNAALQMGETQFAVDCYRDALGRFGVHRPDLRAYIQSQINTANR